MAIVPYWITDVYCGLNVTRASPLIQVDAGAHMSTQLTSATIVAILAIRITSPATILRTTILRASTVR